MNGTTGCYEITDSVRHHVINIPAQIEEDAQAVWSCIHTHQFHPHFTEAKYS